jgi:hypothetical protein
MTAQSSSFSNTLRGSPTPGKRAKRVPPGTGAPAWHGHGEGLCQRRQFFNILAAARQHASQRRVVGVQVRLQCGILLGHQAAIDHAAHVLSPCVQRGAWAGCFL